MGWKTSAIFFKSAEAPSPEALVGTLGIGARTPQGREVRVEEAFSPDGLYVGKFGDVGLVFDPDLPARLLDAPVELERLSRAWPGAQVGVFVLESASNLYALAIAKDGVIVRSKSGSAGQPVTERGNSMPGERRVLARYTAREEKGTLAYVDGEGAAWSHDQLGDEWVFEVMADFPGERPDRAHRFMQETKVFGWRMPWWQVPYRWKPPLVDVTWRQVAGLGTFVGGLAFMGLSPVLHAGWPLIVGPIIAAGCLVFMFV
jgi:hypothetical protein